MTLQIGWFSTGRGPGSRGMLEHTLQAIDTGRLDAQIQFICTNRETGEEEGSDSFIALAESNGIPVLSRSSRRFRQQRGSRPFEAYRQEYDAAVLASLAPYHPELCILAGYLLILSPLLQSAFTFVNLHPALPGGPKGLWQSVIWELIAQRADHTGIMTFLVTQDVDEGPPLTYTRFSLTSSPFQGLWEQVDPWTTPLARERDGEGHPLFQAIRQEGLRREPHLLVETLRIFASRELSVSGGQLIDAHGNDTGPRDLTATVEAAVASDPR